MYRYSTYPTSRVLECDERGSQVPSIILTVFLIIFFGFRPLASMFVDMWNYTESYNVFQEYDYGFEFNNKATNLIFDNLFHYFAGNSYEITTFFVTIAAIYFACMYWSIRKIFPNDTLYALIVYIGAFSTFSYGTNGIKAGAAASIFLLAFAYYRKLFLVALFCFLSLGFHHSMTLPIVALFLAYLIRDIKYFYFGWLVCLLLSVVHIPGFTEFFAQFTDEGGQGYLLAEETEIDTFVGFRWDFILYSLPPILIGIWANYHHGVKDKLYHLLLGTYITVNGVWMLCMYVPFNNRIAYLSWFILPVLIIYPFLKLKLETRQYIQLNYMVSVYLIFTIFANFYL